VSEYESLRNDLEQIAVMLGNYSSTVNRYVVAVDEDSRRLWDDNAALRDELHAVANRVENLTRALTTDPAEVAAKIVNDANRGILRSVTDDD
jgi:hypothetical protein